MKIIKKAEKELNGYKPVFAVDNKVVKHGLISIGRFGLLSTTIHGNGDNEWYYAVKIGKVVTNGKTQVYKLFVNKLGQITGIATSEYFVRVKKEIMVSHAQVFSVKGLAELFNTPQRFPVYRHITTPLSCAAQRRRYR